MTLKAFDPHRKEFTCNYEKIAEPPLDQETEALFREGLSATSFDLWPNERDFGKAALWTKAAEKKHWQAMLNLASLYLEGKGVQRDNERGIQLVEELMVMGLPRAYDFMGTLHMNGTGVNQDTTRAYAFWSLAAEMGSSDAQAYLGDRLNAVYDDPARAIWGNREIAYKLLRCGYSQENGKAAATLGLSIDIAGDHIQALQILHDGVKFGSEMSAIFLAVDFDTGGTETKYLKDKDRGERYGTIAHMLHLNPDLRLPNLDKVLPLPPAVLPYWDGDKQSLIDGAKPVKAVSPDDVASRFHKLDTPVPQTPQAKYMPDWRVPQGVMREVPMPARELRSTGLLPAPATGIWHGSVDPGHPLAKVFNQWYRQSYVGEGQAFPDPRDRGLDISPADIQWRWMDQANQSHPPGRKKITLLDFSPSLPAH